MPCIVAQCHEGGVGSAADTQHVVRPPTTTNDTRGWQKGFDRQIGAKAAISNSGANRANNGLLSSRISSFPPESALEGGQASRRRDHLSIPYTVGDIHCDDSIGTERSWSG